MAPLFGKKKQRGSLIALIDIESGSVGSALAYIEEGKRPRLFAQERKLISRSPFNKNLFEEIERELEDSFVHINTLVARMRHALPVEDISRVSVFLHAPWVGTEVALERIVPKPHEETLDRLKTSARGYFHAIPVSFHSFSTTATPVIGGIFGRPEEAVVCSIGSEVTELVLMKSGVIKGHATTPTGLSTIVRTLKSHAGVSEAEAFSILNLSKHTREHLWAEAIASGLAHFSSQLKGAAKHLVRADRPQQVFVLSPKNSSDWFARSLTEDQSLHELFYPGSTIRGVTSRFASEHLSGHPKVPDVALMLESLFVDTRFGAQH
jgi:hypothetical protein